MTAHTMEVACLGASLVALLSSAWLFTLKLADLIRVWRSRVNGPTLFMVRDNLRQQAFTMAVCAGMVMLSLSGYNGPEPVSEQALNLLAGLFLLACVVVIDAVFTYRRREKLALLVSIYEGRPGGRRASDPPSPNERSTG